MKNIIKRILKEENLKQSLKQQIRDFGIQDASELVGGMDEFLLIMYNNDPMEFLNEFNDLNVVQSTENPDWVLFRFEPKKNIMVYDRKNKTVYINYYEIWSVLQSYFGLNYSEIQRFTKRWLNEVYNLRGITTKMGSASIMGMS